MTIIDVIKNEGKQGYLAWRYPSTELGSWSQLIVGEGEEAVLFACGKAADRFTAGCYTLKTANLPLLGSLLRLPFGNKSPFTAELWYINTAETLDIKWGTDLPIHLDGRGTAVPMLMRGYGQLGVHITDARMFLSALRGRVDSFDKRILSAYLRGQLADAVRDSIAEYYCGEDAEDFERSGASRLIYEGVQRHTAHILERYGLALCSLSVGDLCLSPGDGGNERHLTFSVVSETALPDRVRHIRIARGTPVRKWSKPIIAAAFVLLLLLLLVFCVLLPPRQTADFVGIAFVTAAHCVVTAVVVYLAAVRHGLLVTAGFATTAVLYWLGAVGTALVFRLIFISDTGLFIALQLGMLGVAVLAVMGFWYGRAYDPTDVKSRGAEDDED